MPLPKENEHYTYADYCTWDDNERWELIGGVPNMMSPAPSPIHQSTSRELSYQLTDYLKGKTCKLFTAPFDVRLNADKEDDSVVQPDITIVCDRSKLDDKGCKGVPDMVVEILSPSTARRDKVLKFNEYLQAGVREYWIVDSDTKTVQVCILENGKYTIKAYTDTDTVTVHVLDGCTINLQDVFAE